MFQAIYIQFDCVGAPPMSIHMNRVRAARPLCWGPGSINSVSGSAATSDKSWNGWIALVLVSFYILISHFLKL